MPISDDAPLEPIQRSSEFELSRLTPREREVLALIGQGLSSKEIAAQLHRSIKTVHSHRLTLGRKLGASNRVELARIAIRSGLITASGLPRNQESAAAGIHPTAPGATPALLARIDAAIGSMTGAGLFRALVRNLIKLVDVTCASVWEVTDHGRTARVIACWTKDGPVQDIKCDLKDSPLASASDLTIVGARRNARDLFPSIQLFEDLSIESFLGSPIRDARGLVIGLLALLDDKPIQESRELNLLLTTFAHRCGAEFQRLHTERMLIESRAQLQQAYELNPVPAYMWKIHSGDVVLESYNDAALTSTDGHVQHLIGTSAREFFADRPDIVEDIARCIRHRTTYKRETEYSPKALGEQQYMAFTFSFLSPDHVLVHTEDITERKQMADALRESEERAREQLAELELLYDEAPLGLCHMTTDLRFTRCNEKLAEINGIPADEHIGQTLREVVPEIAESMEPVYQKVIESGEAVIDVVVTGATAADPMQVRHFSACYYPIKSTTGVVEGVSSIVQDITERKRAEEALRKSEERLQLAARGSGDGLWDWDIQTDKEWWSQRFYELLGYDDGEIEPSYDNFKDMLHPDEREGVLEAVRAHLHDKARYDIELRMRSKTGTYRWFRSRGQAVWGRAGKPLRMAGSIQEITDRK